MGLVQNPAFEVEGLNPINGCESGLEITGGSLPRCYVYLNEPGVEDTKEYQIDISIPELTAGAVRVNVSGQGIVAQFGTAGNGQQATFTATVDTESILLQCLTNTLGRITFFDITEVEQE